MSTKATAWIVLLFTCSSCGLPYVDGHAHLAYLSLAPTGNLALEDTAKTNNLDNVTIDIDDGFDIDESGTPVVHGIVSTEDWDIVVSGFYFDESGRSRLTSDFGDIQASVASPVDVSTDLTIYNIKGALAYRLLDLEVFDLSAGLCIDYFDTKTEVRSAVAFEKMSFEAPVPMAFGRASVGLGVVRGALEVGWMDLKIGDTSGSFFDLDAMVAVNPLPFLEIVAGYRNILIDADGDFDGQNYDTHLRLSGWYLGGGVTF